MQEAMYPVEVKSFPEQDYPEKQNKPDWIIIKLKRGRKASINSAKIYNFVEGPYWHTPSNGPEHIVEYLISKSKSTIITHHISNIEFQTVTLKPHGPEPQM